MNFAYKKKVITLSLIGFLLSLQLGFITFIDSAYLSKALSKYTDSPDNLVGYFYAFVSLISLISLIYLPKILRKFGNTKLITISSIILPISLLLLFFQINIAVTLISYILTTICSIVILTSSDLFLSSYVEEETSGFVRGAYFTLISLGFMISPAISGFVVEIKGLEYAYLLGAICTFALSFISYFTFKNYTDPKYEDVPLLPNRELLNNASDLMPVFWAHFSLQSFYAIMIVYVPLYFIEHIGLEHDTFGFLLTIALSTFVILPTFLGYIADKYLGEKEMIITGIILMGASILFIPILAKHPQPLYVWGLLLFISRIGATMTEIMSDVFFFKKIEHSHPALIAFYRRSKPLARLIIPSICAVLLSTRLVDMSEIFIIFGILIIASIYFPLKIIDTK